MQATSRPGTNPWDCVIVGGGPAGFTAGLFLGRLGRRTLVVDPMVSGHMMTTGTIADFPGFPDGVFGPELLAAIQRQAMDAGAEILPEFATNVRRVEEDGLFEVETRGDSVTARTVVLSMGSSLSKLGVPGEAEVEGRGLSHCATCDGPLYKGRTVAVVGGGDSALGESLVLAEYASTVTLLLRNGLTGQQALREKVLATPNISVRSGVEVTGLAATSTGIDVRLVETGSGDRVRLDVAGLFVFVGLEPNTAFVAGLVDLDATGHVRTDLRMRTSMPGVFAAGDVRAQSSSQFVSAAGDGATAALAAHAFLSDRSA